MHHKLLFGKCGLCAKELWNFPGIKVPIAVVAVHKPMKYDTAYKMCCISCVRNILDTLQEKVDNFDYLPPKLWQLIDDKPQLKERNE